MAISTFKRYEIKFLLSEHQFRELSDILPKYMNPDAYCQDGKTYSIYNIYYDTPDNNLIRTSLLGPYYKEKLRLRSYAPSAGASDRVFLELKKKTGGIVHKRRATMTLKEANEFLLSGKQPKSDKYIDRQVENELAYFLSFNPVQPTTYISYRRMAFFGKDDCEFRLTLDQDITTRRDHLQLSAGNFGEKLLEPGCHLMEVKITGAMPLWLAEFLSEIKVYKTSFSKYGMEYKNYCAEQKRDHAVFTPNGVVALYPKICVSA